MTLVEHLYELRYRLGVALAAIAVGAVFGFWWFTHPIFAVPSLNDLLLGPYCALPSDWRLSPNGQCQLLQTRPFEVFFLRMKVGIAVGALVLSPVWLYQLWSFITPGLYARERRFAQVFVGCASALFIAGGVLAYYVVPVGLQFMVGLGGDGFFTALTGGDYINFVLLLLLVFGVSFELPLVVVMLNFAGVLSYEQLKNWWRGVLLGLFAFAAVVTPQDPFSMLALGGALSLLFLAALLICRVHDARKHRRDEFAGLAPDEPSKVDHRPSRMEPEDGDPTNGRSGNT
ncbi:twin-arginine translocase subunit TatC [Salinifilum ghardaiensis]